jgi:hypothetical protein
MPPPATDQSAQFGMPGTPARPEHMQESRGHNDHGSNKKLKQKNSASAFSCNFFSD